jgi:glutamyl-tRNA(Gln) amidotransferase subunit E
MTDPARIGLEIHQQLDTHKLFCNCPSELVDEEGLSFVRRLRPTQSELGEVDAAALEEARKNLQFVYQAPDTTCLVEADEEPPHAANSEAVEIALTVALMMGCTPVEEVHFMRKIVIDGSNTTGFQRTALVATDGAIEVDGKRIGVSTICLEEDAARKIREEAGRVVYRLDRLGIPLVEVATAPDIRTPEEAKAVALRIGSLLRATRRVKRGLGTIREDLNVSWPGGARIEIKGVQELGMIGDYVAGELERQQRLLEARETLEARDAAVDEDPADLTGLLRDTRSDLLASVLRKSGVILGLRLRGFAGTLKGLLGPEIAGRVRGVGVAGILHSDELPAHGVTEGEVSRVREALSCGEEDAFVLVAESQEKAAAAMEAVSRRATEALEGVPEETRDPRPDGGTSYSRSLPGRARMYPETDVPPIRVTEAWVERLRSTLPDLPEVRVERYQEEYGLHRQQASQLVVEGCDDLFEELAARGHAPKVLASTLLNTLPELSREGVDVAALGADTLAAVFEALDGGTFAKEAVPDVLRSVATGRSLEETVEALGLAGLGREELAGIIDRILDERMDFVRERGEAAAGPLMGAVMNEVRGRADGALVNEVLMQRLRSRLG